MPAGDHARGSAGPGAPLVHTTTPLAGHFADLYSLRPQPGGICHRFGTRGATPPRSGRGRPRRRGHLSVPGGAALRDGAPRALAAWDESGALTVWASTQNPYSVRVELAKMFGVPLSRIRIVVPHLGGGFGSKTYAKLGRWPRPGPRGRPPGPPGRLDGGRLPDGAALRPLASPCAWAFSGAAAHRPGVSRRLRRRRVRRHRPPRRSKRHLHGDGALPRSSRRSERSRRVHQHHAGRRLSGFGVPQLAWALESLFDVAADRLGRIPSISASRTSWPTARSSRRANAIDGKFEESLGRAAEAIG